MASRVSDNWPNGSRILIESYPKAIAHLRRQHEMGRLALIFGAGASIALGFPAWPHLVERIALHPSVDGGSLSSALSKKPLTLKTEILFRHFTGRIHSFPEGIESNVHYRDKYVNSLWKKVLHECLYEGIPDEPQTLFDLDKVYKHFLDVIRTAPITVTYNFDDTIERLLLHTRHSSRDPKGFETVVDARLSFRTMQGVIYHPNGFLAKNLLETPSVGDLVLNESAFADQLIGSMTGTLSTYLHHLTKSTMLFLGISLADETLRHLLRLNARLNPGHVHYLVEYTDNPASLNESTRKSIREANFETFNLVTLFLDGPGIEALGYMLSAEMHSLRELADEAGRNLSYTYYLTGVPGSGKTTTFQHFSSLVTFDEWLDERLSLLAKPADSLTDDERDTVDHWILQQVASKNSLLLKDEQEIGVGIRIIDRCPIDLFSFTPYDDWMNKAKALSSVVSPGHSNRRLHDGHVILLTGDPHELRVRAAIRDRQTGADDAYMERLQNSTRHVYDKLTFLGVTEFDCQGMSREDVVRAVARLIFLDSYAPADIHGRMMDVCNGNLLAWGADGSG